MALRPRISSDRGALGVLEPGDERDDGDEHAWASAVASEGQRHAAWPEPRDEGADGADGEDAGVHPVRLGRPPR